MAKASRTAWFNAAKSWDFVRIESMLKETPELIPLSDAKGLNALHMACAVKPGKTGVHEANGLKTVSALLDGGIEIESVAFTDRDGGEWHANAVWFAPLDLAKKRRVPKQFIERMARTGARPLEEATPHST